MTAVTKRRRLEPDARRREILHHARRLFGERPYADVSTTDIAEASGAARGLINHYFGTKRDLYLEVIREVLTVPATALQHVPEGSLEDRVDAAVNWFLDTLSRHGPTWLMATGVEGMARDAELARIIRQADNDSADRLLEMLGFEVPDDARDTLRAMTRAYSGMVRTGGREWLENKSLRREELHALLVATLLTLVGNVFPRAAATRDTAHFAS
jgi:AcrR family transcriptional regulator